MHSLRSARNVGLTDRARHCVRLPTRRPEPCQRQAEAYFTAGVPLNDRLERMSAMSVASAGRKSSRGGRVATAKEAMLARVADVASSAGAQCVFESDEEMMGSEADYGRAASPTPTLLSCPGGDLSTSYPNSPSVASQSVLSSAASSGVKRSADGSARPSSATSPSTDTFSCWVCGRSYPHKELALRTSEGSKQECLYCNRAVQALTRAATSQGSDSQERLSLMRKADQVSYRRLVLQLRVARPGEAPIDANVAGCSNSAERLGKLRELFHAWEAYQKCSMERRVVYLNKRQFICHHTLFEGLSKDEAAHKFARAEQDDSVVKKRDEDNQLVVAVRLPEMERLTDGFAQRYSYGEKSGAAPQQLDAVVGRFRNGSNSASLELVDKMNLQAFQVGGAVKPAEQDHQPKQQGLSEKQLRLRHVIASVRGLDVDGPDRVACPTDVSGVALVDARHYLLSEVRRSQASSGKQTSILNRLQETIANLGEDHHDVASSGAKTAVARHKEALSQLAEVSKIAPTWTESLYGEEFIAGIQLLETARDELTKMQQALQSLTEVRRASVHKQASDRRRTALNTRRILGDGLLTAQGLPKPLMTSLGSEVMGVDETERTMTLTTCARLSHTHTDDMTLPFLAKLDGDATFSSLALAKTILRDRTNKGMAKMSKQAEADQAIKVLFLHFKQGKQPSELTSFDWVPEHMQKFAAQPLAVDAFGAPWLYYSAKFGYRHGPAVDPYPGVGSFVMGVAGCTALILWPMEDTVAHKAGIMDAITLLERLSSAAARKFMQHAVCVALTDR